MGENLAKAFTISFNGERKINVDIAAPGNDYLRWAPHALVKNSLFIFGGTDRNKVKKKLEIMLKYFH